MAGSRRLKIDIVGDAKGLAAAFGQTDSHLGRLSRGIGGIAKSAALGFAGIAGAAVIAGPKILELGTQLDTIANKSATVFGSSLGEVEAWADGVASSMGLTTDQAVGLAANMGDLLKPMGFTAAEAAGMSTEMLDLSGALSAWSGGTRTAAEVSEIMTKAMLGEREQLKDLGISISEADVQRQLAINGTEDLTGAELEQAKALATQQLILAKSTDAQAAWSDGTMDGIKAQNEATASIEEVKEGLVKALFPALQAAVPHIARMSQFIGDRMPAAMETARAFVQDRLIPAFNQYLLPIIERVVAFVRDNWPQISAAIVAGVTQVVQFVQQHWPEIQAIITRAVEAIQAIVESVISIVVTLWQTFGDDILAFVQDVWPEIQQVIQGAIDVIQGIFQAFAALFSGDWSALWDSILMILSGAWSLIQGAFGLAIDAVEGILSTGWGVLTDITGDFVSGIVDAITGIPGQLLGLVLTFAGAGFSLAKALLDGLGSALSSVAGWAGDVGAAVVGAVKSLINSQVIGRINSALEFTVPLPFGLGSFTVDPPDIPMLAAGGIVTRPTLAIVGEAGPEAVIPLSRGGRQLAGIDGGGQPIVINLHLNGQQIARVVADESQRAGGLPFAVSAL